jgi:hypothetical protein
MTDKQIIFKCDVDCVRKNTEECFELDCIKGQESILKQLQAKEQECERLKNFHINLVGVKECEIKELLKLKQTLTEIKEIAEVCRASLYGYDQEKYPKQILQKISEVEDEHNG